MGFVLEADNKYMTVVVLYRCVYVGIVKNVKFDLREKDLHEAGT